MKKVWVIQYINSGGEYKIYRNTVYTTEIIAETVLKNNRHRDELDMAYVDSVDLIDHV